MASDKIQYVNKTFTNENFYKSCLDNFSFEDCKFENCVFEKSSFTDTAIKNCTFDKCQLNVVMFYNSEIEGVKITNSSADTIFINNCTGTTIKFGNTIIDHLNVISSLLEEISLTSVMMNQFFVTNSDIKYLGTYKVIGNLVKINGESSVTFITSYKMFDSHYNLSISNSAIEYVTTGASYLFSLKIDAQTDIDNWLGSSTYMHSVEATDCTVSAFYVNLHQIGKLSLSKTAHIET